MRGLVALVFAMESELRAVRGLWGEESTPLAGLPYPLSLVEVDGRELLVLVTGVGKVHAATSVLRLVERYSPSCIVNVGCCGGIAPSLSVGDLVVSEVLAYHDVWCGEPNAPGQVQGMPARFAADATLVAGLGDAPVRRGLFCCGEYFAPEGDSVARMRRDFPDALAVDMESTAMAQVCYQEGVPFASLRVVSDTPGIVGADHAAQYRYFWRGGYEVPFGRVVGVLRSFLASNHGEKHG